MLADWATARTQAAVTDMAGDLVRRWRDLRAVAWGEAGEPGTGLENVAQAMAFADAVLTSLDEWPGRRHLEEHNALCRLRVEAMERAVPVVASCTPRG